MATLPTSLGLALAGALLAATPGAHAVSFDILASGPDTMTLMDRTAVERVGDGQVRRAWSVNVQRNMVSGGPPQPGYVRTLNEYDCAGWRIRWRSFSVYSRFGRLILEKDNPDPAWAPVGAAPEARAGARLVCDGASTGGALAGPSIGQVVISLMQAWDPAPMPSLQPVIARGGPAAAGPPGKPAGKHRAADRRAHDARSGQKHRDKPQARR